MKTLPPDPPFTEIWSNEKSSSAPSNSSPLNRSSSEKNESDTSGKNAPSEGSSTSSQSNSSDERSSSSQKLSWSNAQNESSSNHSSTRETAPPKKEGEEGDATTREIHYLDLAQLISKFKHEIKANRDYRTPFMDEPVPPEEIEVIPGVMNFELPHEGQAAAEGYAKFAVEIRQFYLNLLVRPSWQKKREDVRTAFAQGLIHYGTPSPIPNPLLTL
jgi:hypothetical protein